MSNTKKYILTGVILGSIAAVAAGLISLTNLITKDRIILNEKNKINAGISGIFGDSAHWSEEGDVENKTYTAHYYKVVNSEDEFLGYALRSNGSNMYGKISMISGFDKDSNFISLSLITNEQTYASTLVDNYITPLNKGERETEDVKCGATYGATLVNNMIIEASEVAAELNVR